MIAHLRGKLISKHPNQAIVEAGGVGYEVNITIPTFSALPALGADVALFVATTSFTPDARAIAETYGINLVDRAHLEKWSAGVTLPILR